MCAGDDAEWYRDQYRDQHRGDGQFNCCWIAFEDQILNRSIVAKRETHVALEQCAPIVNVTIIDTVPDEVSLIIRVAWEREEEGRTIEAVLFAKLCKLFRRRLFAEHGDSRITGDKFD